MVKREEDNIKNEHGIKHENGVIEDDTVELIRDYFNLSVNLTELYEKWSSRDPHFKKKAPAFTGIRMLRQDPWENLVSFICSSNNNISRIGQMVNSISNNIISISWANIRQSGRESLHNIRHSAWAAQRDTLL